VSPSNLEVLELLLERATGERDRLTAARRQADDAAQSARTQGEQLAAYRSEYVARWSSQFGRGGAIEIVHCYRSFMQRLDEAVEQQARHVDGAERLLAQAQALLVDAELRVASVRKLIERRRAEAQRDAQRRDQRQTDETSQQVSMRRHRGGLAALQH
jgi:flagellar protein FliJ